MDGLKGQGTALLWGQRNGKVIALAVYLDESWGIWRDGKALCVWEPAETADCVTTFLRMLGREGDRTEVASTLPLPLEFRKTADHATDQQRLASAGANDHLREQAARLVHHGRIHRRIMRGASRR
jgi:hypothetical protein